MSGKRPLPPKRKRKSKPSVAIVGSGRLGTAFGIALAQAGYPIRLVVALHERTARRAANLINGQAESASIGRVIAGRVPALRNVDLALIATPDDAIQEVAKQLAACFDGGTAKRGAASSNRVALHTSGARSSDELRLLRAKGFATGSIHPLISISKPASGAAWLHKAFFSLEGDAKALRIARQLVADLGGNSFRIPRVNKPLYHAAALMASPNLTALFDIALRMLTRCGLSRARAHQVLLPLVQSTLENLQTQDPAEALTGPLQRGDVATIEKHISAIKATKLRETLPAYVALARHSASLANELRNRPELLQLLRNAAEGPRE
jgi:predicted short-subunit dehydrogenase-like oxidoreductase (DUF2520 family)